MALIKCTECAREISDTSKTCVGCGAKVKKKSVVIKVFTWFLGFIAFVITFQVVTSPSPAQKAVTVQEKKEPLSTEQIKAITKPFNKNYDKVENITWIHSYKRSSANSDYIYVYLGERDNQVWGRLVIHIWGNSWYFMDGAIFLIDGVREEIAFARDEIKRDNGGGVIWETADAKIYDGHIRILNKIANSNETIIRIKSDKYKDDRVISKKEKQALKKILEAYEKLKD